MDFINRVSLIFLLLTFVVSCQSLPEGSKPEVATWLYGEFTLPASATKSGYTESFSPSYASNRWTTSAEKELKPGVKVPLAIHLHGCAGIHDESLLYRDLMLSQGYAVIMPDSFQRSNREKLCGQGKMLYRITIRQQEVKYALKRIRELPWVDQDRLVLTGFSEGGNAADMWHTDDFAGIIVFGSACGNGGVVLAPKDIPVLAIVGEHDDYRPGLSCRITRKVGGSESIVIPGADHWVATYPQTQEAVTQFLRQCCS